MKQRVIWGAIALLIMLPFLLHGGLLFQVFVGFLAMIGVAEMLRMKHLEFFSIEGVLSMLGAFVLTVPLDNYFTSLPIDSNFAVYGFSFFWQEQLSIVMIIHSMMSLIRLQLAFMWELVFKTWSMLVWGA